MVSHQHKHPGMAQGAQAGWQGELRGLINDTVVEGTTSEERVGDTQARGSHHKLEEMNGEREKQIREREQLVTWNVLQNSVQIISHH